METTKRFGDVVARLRREKGLTQEQLAACVGGERPGGEQMGDRGFT